MRRISHFKKSNIYLMTCIALILNSLVHATYVSSFHCDVHRICVDMSYTSHCYDATYIAFGVSASYIHLNCKAIVVECNISCILDNAMYTSFLKIAYMSHFLNRTYIEFISTCDVCLIL